MGGKLDQSVAEIRKAADALEALRSQLLADPYFKQVPSMLPAESAGLQVTDYLLWSLQRLYERREERYVELLWPAFRLVHDLDDTRQAQYGVYYTQKKPLALAALKAPEI